MGLLVAAVVMVCWVVEVGWDPAVAGAGALVVVIAVAAHLVGNTVGGKAPWSWALLGPRLRRSAVTAGLTFPLGQRRGYRAVLRVVLWWVVVPVASAVVLLRVGGAVVSWLPAPSGSEVAANADRAVQYSGSLMRILTGVLAVGVVEELLFRGPLLVARRLCVIYHPRYGRAVVLVVAVLSTVAFAFGHLEFGAGNVAAALVYGAMWAAIALRSGSLWPAIAAHFAFDAWLFLHA